MTNVIKIPFKQMVFHGGCHGCTQQQIHSISFCQNCCYFDTDWELPNLNNAYPTDAEIYVAKVKASIQKLSFKHKLRNWLYKILT
jgi:hypothetical protein